MSLRASTRLASPRLAVVSRSVHSIPQPFTVACACTVAHARRALAHHCSSAVDAAAACSLRSGRTAERWDCHFMCSAALLQRQTPFQQLSFAIPTDRSRFVRTTMRAARRSAVSCFGHYRVLPLHCEFSLGFSRYTALRQDSLSGNCKTSLVVCVSPLPANINETVGALDFGMRAMQAWHRNAWHSACTCTRAHPQCRPWLDSSQALALTGIYRCC